MPSQISNKIEKRRHAVATDRNGSEIRHDDTVREIGGEQKQGVILHIHRSFLFCHNREQTENSGIFVVRATNVATVAAKGGRVAQAGSTGPDLSRMNPALQRNGANGNGAMAPPKSFGRDRALGQTVSIRKGPYKGLLGIVKDTTDLEARVELHTKAKTVTVAKEILGFKDPITGNTIDFHSFSGSRGKDSGARGGFSGAAPARTTDWQNGSRTPAGPGGFGGRTPAWSASNSRTPAWSGGASSARTPVWRPDGQATNGARTPAWSAEGGRTAYGGGGNQTAYGGAGGVSNCSNTYRKFPLIANREHLRGIVVAAHLMVLLLTQMLSAPAPRLLHTTLTLPARQHMLLLTTRILTHGHVLMMLPPQPPPHLPTDTQLLLPLRLRQHQNSRDTAKMLQRRQVLRPLTVASRKHRRGEATMMDHDMMMELRAPERV